MQKKNPLRLVIEIVTVVLVIAAVVIAWQLLQPKNDGQQATEPSKTEGVAFTVVVVHGDGTEKTFSYTSDEKYVGTVLQAEGLISGDQGQYGLYIKVVDGERADYELDGAYWSLLVNDQEWNYGVDQTAIEEGATYKLVYTKG